MLAVACRELKVPLYALSGTEKFVSDERLFEFENITLTIEDQALDYMVKKAVQYKLGGPGLRAICEMILTDAMFDLPSEKHDGTFHLTLEYAQQMIEHSKLEQIKKAA